MTNKYSALGRARCKIVPRVAAPACELVLHEDRGPCDAAEGDSREICARATEFLSGSAAACDRPDQVHLCIAGLLVRGSVRGRGVCDDVAPVGERDTDFFQRLHLQCLAILDQDPEACPADPEGQWSDAPPTLKVEARAFLRFDPPGTRATIAATSNTPVLCAIEVAAVKGKLTVDRKISTLLLQSGQVLVTHTPYFARDPDPFEAKAELEHVCVPVISWERAAPRAEPNPVSLEATNVAPTLGGR